RALGDVEGLPDPQDGTVYLVSSMVLSAVRGRRDVVAPDTGPTAIRDETGRITAVTRLVVAGDTAQDDYLRGWKDARAAAIEAARAAYGHDIMDVDAYHAAASVADAVAFIPERP
ncbi:MAG: hypothetical protein D6800_07370, partial [Candidatus Zixiibacteriota bacterium]